MNALVDFPPAQYCTYGIRKIIPAGKFSLVFKKKSLPRKCFSSRRSNLKNSCFHYRAEIREVGKGQVFRMSCSPFYNQRTRSEIARSSIDTFCGVIAVSGSMTIVRGHHSQVIKPGALFLYDSADPVTLCHGNQEQFGFIVEKANVPIIENNMDLFRFVVKDRDNISAPLRNLLYFLGDRFSGNDGELSAILNAIISLLPIEAGLYHSEDFALKGEVTALYLDILSFADSNLGDPSLSASVVARRFGISERYVYKIFAERGLRFGDYIKNKRLQFAARSLISGRLISITEMAYRCGFSDLSTFSRTFKKHFGCGPREYRARY